MPERTRGEQILFRVRRLEEDSPIVLVHAGGREEAKRLARLVLRHDPDRYEVEPITRPGSEVEILAPVGYYARESLSHPTGAVNRFFRLEDPSHA